MTMSVNQELCTGCGVCVNECDNGAIYMSEGIAHIDSDKCTTCQTCVDVCPTGALEVSAAENEVITVHPREVEVIDEKPPVFIEQERPNWSVAVLSMLGQYVLPRLVDVLAQYFEQRLSAPEQGRNPMTINRVENRPFRRRRQNRRRFSNMVSQRRCKNA